MSSLHLAMFLSHEGLVVLSPTYYLAWVLDLVFLFIVWGSLTDLPRMSLIYYVGAVGYNEMSVKRRHLMTD